MTMSRPDARHPVETNHNKADNAVRPSARRGPSGAWSRLKPAVIDPLDAYGLPSKGETRYGGDRSFSASLTVQTRTKTA